MLKARTRALDRHRYSINQLDSETLTRRVDSFVSISTIYLLIFSYLLFLQLLIENPIAVVTEGTMTTLRSCWQINDC